MSKLHRTLAWTIDEWIRDNWHEGEVEDHAERWEEFVRSAIHAGKLGSLCRFADLLANDPQLRHVGRALISHDLDPTQGEKDDGAIILPAMRETPSTGYHRGRDGQVTPSFDPRQHYYQQGGN